VKKPRNIVYGVDEALPRGVEVDALDGRQ